MDIYCFMRQKYNDGKIEKVGIKTKESSTEIHEKAYLAGYNQRRLELGEITLKQFNDILCGKTIEPCEFSDCGWNRKEICINPVDFCLSKGE